MIDLFLDCLVDALKDSAKLVPFLFIIYLLMEILEHKSGAKIQSFISRGRRVGPLAGGLLGAVPQCGLASASASLYSRRIITLGTLVAIFLSSSDEMLPILISESVNSLTIIKILAIKSAVGIVTGYVIDLVIRRQKNTNYDTHVVSEPEHESNPILCALRHTIEIFIDIFIFSLILNFLIQSLGQDKISKVFSSVPVVGQVVAGLVGLIPNCASSVIITKLFIEGIIGPGPMIAGLLVNSGVGSIVLFKTNHNLKENISIIAFLYLCGVIWGIIIGLLPLTF